MITDHDESDLNKYIPSEIEQYWRERWRENHVYRTPDPSKDANTFYCLDFFPYPSGAGLSVGHGRNYVPSDVVARYHRMKGEKVLHPMGWDAFGLPAENEAIKIGSHPSQSTTKYAAHYKYQLDLMGCSYDWEREISSSDPSYYRWNQFMFLMLFERGLAYRQNARVNWCPSCQTVLAAEEIEEGLCWRCHQPIIIQERKQWFIRVTKYAEELHAGLEKLDWPAHIVNIQKHWIGRSDGVEVKLVIPDVGEIAVFTTRIDTLFGVTFFAMSPEHPMAGQIADVEHRTQVENYIGKAAQRTFLERHTSQPDGVPTGRYVQLPWGDHVPLYIADYVLISHGTGIVMGVPAHDGRDFAFAKLYNLPIKQVVVPDDATADAGTIPFTDYGVLVNSHQFDDMSSSEAQHEIVKWLSPRNIAEHVVHYRLKDWLISRQRYWGTPIPIIHCKKCGEVPVPVDRLPVLLPSVPDFTPRGDGRAPLANVLEFVNTQCPKCGGEAQRETDTMTGFVCSSWYYMRFTDPHNNNIMFGQNKAASWLPVDMYVGGEEHAVGHLLYSRFWTKFLADAGVVPFREPFPVLRSQGVLHIRDRDTGRIERMSKSKGNVVTPENVIQEYGADVLRLYLLFMGPFEANVVWDEDDGEHKPKHIDGVRRFLDRIWRLSEKVMISSTPDAVAEDKLNRELDKTINQVTDKIESMHFNVAVSKLMTFSRQLATHRNKYGDSPAFISCRLQLIKLLAPFAPFITEELWFQLGGEGSVHHSEWPQCQGLMKVNPIIEIPVQVNGKIQTKLVIPRGITKTELSALALKSDSVKNAIGGHSIQKVIVVPERIVNIVLA